MCQMRPISSSPSWPSLPLPLASPCSPFFLLHNKHTSQSFCSLTPRLCRLSEQSQEKSRDREKVKEGKRKEQWGGERERGARVLSKSLFSGSPKQKDDTDTEGLFHVLGAERERDETHHIPSVSPFQNLAVHLFLQLETMLAICYSVLSLFLYSLVHFCTLLPFCHFILRSTRNATLFPIAVFARNINVQSTSFSLNVISHRGKRVKSVGHRYSIMND